MGEDFPVPRSEFPTIEVTPEEHAASRRMMERMLAHTVREFEQLAYNQDERLVDRTKWKPLATQGQLKLYRERQVGALTRSMGSVFNDTSRLPLGSTMAVLTPPSMLMTGYVPGRMEDALYALNSKTSLDLALVVIYLHGDVADTAILNTMEGATEESPFNYLGYKYFVRKSPGMAQVVKHRDSLYLEFTGTTTTSTGEVIGHHLMHSVDLPGFPDLTKRNSLRALQSLRYIYRQCTDDTVEVFMLGNMDISGVLTSITPIAMSFVAETAFNLPKLMGCAQVKRLTEMLNDREQYQTKDKTFRWTKAELEACEICGHRKKKFTPSSLITCDVCDKFVCSRCRINKKVFVADSNGILGKIQKAHCCKSCALIANNGYVEYRKNLVSSSQHSSEAESNYTGDIPSTRPTAVMVHSSESIVLLVDDTIPDVGTHTSESESPQQPQQSTPEVFAHQHRKLSAPRPVRQVNSQSNRPTQRSASNPSPWIMGDQSLLPATKGVSSISLSSVSDAMTEESFSSVSSSISSNASGPSAPTHELMVRMIELTKLAESTHYIAQKNAALLAQQYNSQHQADQASGEHM